MSLGNRDRFNAKFRFPKEHGKLPIAPPVKTVRSAEAIPLQDEWVQLETLTEQDIFVSA